MQGNQLKRLGKLAALVLSGGLLATASASAAPNPLTVTPDTNLPESTTVQISGSGFAPGSVLYQQCTGPYDDRRCKPPGNVGNADAGGNFAASLAVSRTFVDGGTHDCRVVTCYVWAAEAFTGEEVTHNIDFTPLPSPSPSTPTALVSTPAALPPASVPKKCKKGRKLKKGKCVRKRKR